MTENIDKLISENKYSEALEQCKIDNCPNLGLLLHKLWSNRNIYIQDNNLISELNIMKNNIKYDDDDFIRVMVLCYWTESQQCNDIWDKQSKGNNTWNKIKLVDEEPIDYYVVISATNYNIEHINPKKIIIFRMNPNMEMGEFWGKWSKPDIDKYLFVGYHDQHYNNNEWWLSKNYQQLCEEKIEKQRNLDTVLSTILSDKYDDPGHKKRIDFVKFLELNGFKVDVFGGNKFEWKDYKGSLPTREKDAGLFPYKYTFNVENYTINNYYTEKLIDGILAECLTFYHGCPNISEHINNKAYVWLALEDFEADFNIIKTMIEENEWSKRIDIIRKEKQRILNDQQFFPRLEKIINSDINK